MSIVATRNLTMADVARLGDPNGGIADVVELFMDSHEILMDAVFVECNDGTNNKTTVRTGIPEPTWRKMYGGVLSTKGAVKQVVDSCGMLEALPKIDCDVIDKSPDKAKTMLTEHKAHLQGLQRTLENTLFYGDTDLYPERFMGLHPRYDAYTRATPDVDYSDYNVINGGGSGADNTSIWLLNWSDEALHMLYPRGSNAGLIKEDLGKQLTVADNGSGDYQAYVTKYKQDVGLCVRNWNSVGRICNIDVSNLISESSAADLIKLMIRLAERVEGNGRAAWYMNHEVRTMLRIQMLGKTNVNLTFDTVEGKRVLAFDGVPIRATDKRGGILLTEAALPQAS